jgi:hypothetical protein
MLTERIIPIPIGTTARGFLFECVAVLDLFLLENKIDDNKYQVLLGLAEEISKLLYTMIKNLST